LKRRAKRLDTVQEYLQACKHLDEIRLRHNGKDSVEEEAHLEVMDTLWMLLTTEEKNEINKLGEAASAV
jgi:hypothetical protein